MVVMIYHIVVRTAFEKIKFKMHTGVQMIRTMILIVRSILLSGAPFFICFMASANWVAKRITIKDVTIISMFNYLSLNC